MIGLLILGALAMSAFVVLAVLGTVGSLVFGLFTLPFRILGWIVRGSAALLLLPFLLLAGLIGVVVFGVGIMLALVPALPFIALVFLCVWLFRRRAPAVRQA